MAAMGSRLGIDLHLFANLEEGWSRDPGHDLRTVATRRSGRPETAGGERLVDLARLEGVENLRQALLARLLTARGELARLGHRDYGSRLFELVGEPNTETTRDRAKLYVLEALAAEPRVAEVVSAEVRSRGGGGRRDALDVALEIRVAAADVDGGTVLNLVFPFFLDGGGP